MSVGGPSVQGRKPKMTDFLVVDLVVKRILAALTCSVLGFSKQTVSAWRAHPETQLDWDDAHLIKAAREEHTDDREFGRRFIADELDREHGIPAGENNAQRLRSLLDVSFAQTNLRHSISSHINNRRPGPHRI